MQKLTPDDFKNLGPLAGLVGNWEGTKGEDIAPDDERKGEEKSLYKEIASFEYIGMVDNHEQILYGLKYNMKAWETGHVDSYHEETGYWLWDVTAKQVMKCFSVPRGIALIAGGSADVQSKKYKMISELGSATFGISSNPFLDKEFQTVKYEIEVEIASDQNSWSYRQTTFLKVPYQSELFLHTDKNTLARTS